ncbi:MAG TPA: phage tail protein [Pyrinomonadaceae bacterium]|nr:phage tail protein [Pyrinomonadaceae bacterium]
MVEPEFKVQVIETDAQWKSGLWSRLDFGPDGLSLFLNPAFEKFLFGEKAGFHGGDIVVDECGQTYWTALEGTKWTLFRHNPLTDQVERVLTFSGCDHINPRELWLDSKYLWIFDQTEGESRKGRMLAFSRDNWQIILEFVIDELIDVDFQPQGYFYSIEKNNDGTQVCRYSTTTPAGKSDCFTLKTSKEQVAVAAGAEGIVYLLDAVQGRLIRFDPETKKETVLAVPQEKLLKGFKPSAMQIDQRGVIFLASSNPASLHMFDKDGSYLGHADLPSKVTRIDGIGFTQSGGVLLATDQGLAKFSLSKNPVGQEGVFYSRTLDNGQPESLWHRVALQGRIPTKSSVEVYYFASDNQALKDAYDKAFSGTGSIEEKTNQIESMLGTSWTGPETFKGLERPKPRTEKPGEREPEQIDKPDLILNPNKGRYLWLKLKLTTFDQKSRPAIRSARIYYPRLSYLRYLPPVYREDPVSAAFLERFLSIFETSFGTLEQEIDQLFRYFDPNLAPKDFLPWLASWINLSLDDDVPEQRVRHFIRRAASLYSRKGTARALVEFLEIYTGKSVFITEFLRGLKPMIVGEKDSVLGGGLVLLGSGPKGMRVGDTSVVGYSAVRDRVSDPDEPFLALARRFTVTIDMDREEFLRRQATLTRIVTEQAPAHTSFTIRVASDRRTIGKAVLGISAKVEESRPYRVGLTQLGSGSATGKGPDVLRLERGAWVGSSRRM